MTQLEIEQQIKEVENGKVMNKELEALEKIKETIIPSTRSNWETEYYYVGDIGSTIKYFHIVEQALKRNKPMKVDLETILSLRHADIYDCPKCGGTFIKRWNNYCPDCGQKLDWKE